MWSPDLRRGRCCGRLMSRLHITDVSPLEQIAHAPVGGACARPRVSVELLGPMLRGVGRMPPASAVAADQRPRAGALDQPRFETGSERAGRRVPTGSSRHAVTCFMIRSSRWRARRLVFTSASCRAVTSPRRSASRRAWTCSSPASRSSTMTSMSVRSAVVTRTPSAVSCRPCQAGRCGDAALSEWPPSSESLAEPSCRASPAWRRRGRGATGPCRDCKCPEAPHGGCEPRVATA